MTASRLKLVTIVVTLALGALVMLTWTREWLLLTIAPDAPLVVLGQSAASALSGLGLATLALAGALSIARPLLRRVLGVVLALLGVLVAVIAVTAIADPFTAAQSAITEATGISGSATADYIVGAVAVTAWPWLAAVVGALLVLVGVLIVVTSQRWPGPTARYETSTTDTTTPAGAWDSLSEGHDPTSDPR